MPPFNHYAHCFPCPKLHRNTLHTRIALIVGVTKYCDYPLAAEPIPKMGGWMDIDFSRVLAQKPDLVFTSTIVQQNVAERARELGLEVLHTDPRSLPEILESIIQIGNAVGRTHRAKEVVREICDDANNLRKKTEHLPKKKLYVEEWPLTVSGNWVPDLLEIAGATGIGKTDSSAFASRRKTLPHLTLMQLS